VNASAIDKTKLIALADRPGGDVKARLLLALTALFVERKTHTAEEKQQYAELAQRLLDLVDATTRSAVVAILQEHPSAPAELVRPPLQTTPGPTTSAAPGAGRLATLVPLHRQAAESNKPLPAPAERGDVFFGATAARRRELLTLIAKECEEQGARATDHPPADCKRLDAAALEGRIGELIRELERILDLPRGLCERIVNDPLGEPMVVAAAAARIPVAVVQRILLLVNPAVSHSVERVFELTNLYYDLDRRAADRLMSLWRDAARREPSLPAAPPVAAEAEPPPLPLRARLGALAERIQDRRVQDRSIQDRGITSRSDRESAGPCDLRSR
jgi:hypothetical protein